jgi:3-hydroxyacyl-CoA dehydrogenase/enoyl-CoA hydratase/carnithine racemase
VTGTEFKLARADTALGPVALVTIDNGADHTRPTVFDGAALESAARVLHQLEDGHWLGAVVTGKPFVFAAGADIDQFPGATARVAREGSRAGHELFGRVRALPFPTLAAINGACLGGGLELALHCRYRTVSSGVRHFGFPEVFLGIVPGWGGTQLAPRVAGTAAAIALVVDNPLRQNRLLDGGKALELGFADALFEPAEFLDESLAFLLERIAAGAKPHPERVPDDSETVAELVRRARARVDDQVHGAAPAPYRALDLIELAARVPLEDGLRAEEEAVAELLPGPESQASLYAYHLVERRAKKQPGRPDAAPRSVTSVGIVGAGLMATQLATLVLTRLEVPVALRDLSDDILGRARTTVEGDLAGRVARGRMSEEKARFLAGLVRTSTQWDVFDGCDLVVEAVFEDMAVKKDVFAELERVVGDEAVLATNTSALSVGEMATDLVLPERVCGLHFFNPLAVMPLVELVCAERTDDAALATAWEVAARLRKTVVPVRDAPGFVVNRLLTRMTRTLMDALERGASVDETDEAVLRLGLPMAPSVLLQLVGPKVARHVLETMHEAWPDRYPLSPALDALAEGRDVPVTADGRPSVEAITTAVLEALADEARHLLEDGVVAEAADIDTCMLLGAGFPFWLGGITKHLDQTGVSARVAGRPLAEVGRTAAA